MVKKSKFVLTSLGQIKENKTLTEKVSKLKSIGKIKRIEISQYNSQPKAALSFCVTVHGNTYPFTFTREQLNEAYGSAMKSVLSEEMKKTAVEIVK